MEQLQEHFRMETEHLRLERQTAENKSALAQAKHDLREAKAAEAEYGSSFRRFRDRLTGKQEEAETTLRHAVQKAEADLASAQRQKETLDTRLGEVKEQLASLPDWESLRGSNPQWYRLEALYCTEVLTPLLEATQELLTERRNQFNGTYHSQVKTWQTLADIYSAPEEAGEACKPYLLRLKAALDALQIPFGLSPYFDNPTAFLSFATKYTRMDRINDAIDQTMALRQKLSELQKELSE